MALQYWVGDFFVDLSRNQVTKKETSKTIAPKALAVLTYLAENQGRVVSYDDIFAKVWPDTIVTPNTLQRSIAQLRKVLGENSQLQSYIKTHAKQGYSLEIEVRWQENTDKVIEDITEKATVSLPVVASKPQVQQSKESRFSFFTTKMLTLIVGIILLFFVAVQYISTEQNFTLSFGELRSLTATDNKELGAIYSPDGKFIVFLRYSQEACINSNIWAKNVETQQESQLTQSMGYYGRASFSPDGKKLLFIKAENCNNPVNVKDCYKLMNLDFEKALISPQSPDMILECQNSRITNATWLKSSVIFLQEISNHWKLVNYSIIDNKSKIIYELEDSYLIDYDYSVTNDIIAIITAHKDGQNYVELLQPNGSIISSHQIAYPPEITNLKYIYPNFTPSSEQLIFSTGRQLFTLSFKGKITKINLPLDEPISSPVFHPNGKRMLVTKGVWDSDIATFPLASISEKQLTHQQTPQQKNKVSHDLTILERTTVGEDNAIYQTSGGLIAFKSRRSGIDQVYTSNGNGAKQLTKFPTDTYIRGMDWAADGQSILVNANNVITQHYLDSTQKNFQFKHRIEQLYQWDSEKNTALVMARIKGKLKLSEFNLENSSFKVITEKKVNWALKSEDGSLIYTDQMDRFWQPGPAEDKLILSLENQGSDKRFIINNNIIYGINKEFQLWSYDRNIKTYTLLGSMPKSVNYLTDINQTDALISIRIKAKKEVAELTLND